MAHSTTGTWKWIKLTLKCSKGNIVAHIVISEKGVSEMQWWLCNLDGSFNPIRYPQVDLTLYSDASLAKWGR